MRKSKEIIKRNLDIDSLNEQGFSVLSTKKDPYAAKPEVKAQAGSGPNPHPIVSKSARFSGSPTTESNPVANPQGQKEHEIRNAPELAARPGMAMGNRKKPKHTYTPLPTRPR